MQAKSRLTDAQVGIFVLTALVMVVVGSLWILGTTTIGQSRVTYRILMGDSSGLASGDRVRFAGMAVGRIQQVMLRSSEDRPVVFEVSLRSDVPVKTDSTARIASSGLLGSPFLLIEPGSPTAPALAAGGEILGASSVDMEQMLEHVGEIAEKMSVVMDNTNGILEQVAAQIGPMLGRVDALLSAENVEDLRKTLTALRNTVEEGGPRLASMLDNLEASSQNLAQGIERLPAITDRASALIEDLRTALGPDGSRLTRVLDAAESGLISADQAMSILTDNRAEIETSLEHLRETMANLEQFSAQIKERPYSLVRKSHEPDRKPGQGVR